MAARWEWAPQVQVGYLFDDNQRLDLPGNEIEVSGVAADARVELRSIGPLTEMRLTPRVRATWFPDARTEDSTDYFLRLDLQHTRQKWRTALLADYEDETVLRSELPDTDFESGLGNPSGVDAGRVQVLNRRQLLRFNPSMSYDLSVRHGLELAANYVSVGFDRTVVGAQVGYDDAGASVGYRWTSSPRSQLILRGLFSLYDPEDTTGDDPESSSPEAKGYGLQAEWRRNLTEATQMYVRAGAQQTDFGANSETGFVAGLGGRRDGEKTSLFIDLTHGVGPTASGFVVNREQLRLRVTHRFTPRLSGYVGVRGIHDEAVQSAADFETRSYATGDVGVEWRMSRQFSLVAGYDYTWQEFQDDPAAARSHGAWVSLVYEPRRN